MSGFLGPVQFINTPIVVNVAIENPGIATNDTPNCDLTTSNSSCVTQVTGKNVGTTKLLASSIGYATASGEIKVSSSPPIAQQCSGAPNGGFSTPTPFDGVNISYTFAPYHLNNPPYGLPLYPSYGTFNTMDWGALQPGLRLTTDASSTNPITIGNVTELVTPGSNVSGGVGQVAWCGGGWTTSDFYTVPDVSLTKRGLIHLYMRNKSTGDCGNVYEENIVRDIPVAGNYHERVYSRDQQGCGGNRWDMWGNVFVDSEGCNGDQCTYAITSNAGHGGDQWCDNSTTYKLTFRRPEVYMQLSNLGNFNQQNASPAFVGGGDQSVSASLSGQGVATSPVITCQSNGVCTSTNSPTVPWYTNGWGGLNYTMAYDILQIGGYPFGQVCINFHPS